jgi:hypothetical protein
MHLLKEILLHCNFFEEENFMNHLKDRDFLKLPFLSEIKKSMLVQIFFIINLISDLLTGTLS